MLRLLAAFWHVFGILLLAVLINEIGIEWWRRANRWLRYRRSTRPDRTAAADAYAGAEWSAAYFDEFRRAVRVDWRPYVEWWQRPYCGAHMTIDGRGLRPTPGEHEAGDDALRILCFGGSTMMGMGARDEHTIAAELACGLARLGHKVAVTNYGQLGHNSTQETITLQQLLKAGERIDVAVFYDGINEMACAEQTGHAEGVFNEARRRAEFNLLLAERRRDLMVAGVIAAAPRTLRRLRQFTGLALRGPGPAPPVDLRQVDIARLARDVICVYRQNLRLVRMLAREFGFVPVFFWQPAITTKSIKTSDELRWECDYTHNPAARRDLYGAIIAERRSSPELAQAEDAVDLSGLFDDCSGPVYIDLYHLSEAGNAAVANAMLPAVATAAEAAPRRRNQ